MNQCSIFKVKLKWGYGMIFDDDFEIHSEAYISPSAVMHGKIRIGAYSSIWDSAVIRADLAPVEIGEGTSIQDNVTIHVDTDYPTKIGNYVTVGHNAVIHGAEIGDHTIVAIHSTILNGAKVGKNCIIGAGAVVTENSVIPDNSLVLGIPAKVVKQLDEKTIEEIRKNAKVYIELAKFYKNKMNQKG
jgi:carbonic anhydrase/acetyltransferase-like protein (isoleucine patch superfamily)